LHHIAITIGFDDGFVFYRYAGGFNATAEMTD
jgi:hypothetical protein